MPDYVVNVILRARNEAGAVIGAAQRDIAALKNAGRGRGGSHGRGLTGVSADDDLKAYDKIQQGVSQTGHALTSLGAAGQKAFGTPLGLAMEFDAVMRRLNAKSSGKFGQLLPGESVTRLDALSKKARELGGSTEFTAAQSAEAFVTLTQAGQNYEEQLASIATVLDIATVAEVNMQTAAKIGVDNLGRFGLAADQMPRVGDAMVRASNASQISIAQLSESFKYAGPVAKGFGSSIEETAIAVAVLGKSGISAGAAGTTLRAFLNRMTQASDKTFATKSQGKALEALGMSRTGLKTAVESGSIGELGRFLSESIAAAKANGRTGAEVNAALQGMFQERGAGGALVMSEGFDLAKSFGEDANSDKAWERISREVMGSTTTVAEMAGIQREGSKSAVTVLNSAMEELGITVGSTVLPELISAAKVATELAGSFGAFAKENPRFVKALMTSGLALTGLATVTGPLLVSLGSFMMVAKLGAPVLRTFVGAAKAGAAGSTKFRGAMGAASVAVIGATMIVGHFEAAIGKARDAANALANDVIGNETGVASGLSDEKLADREAEIEAQAVKLRSQTEARQRALDSEMWGAKSAVLNLFGGSDLSTADDSAARAAEGQYAVLRDERLNREKAKIAGTISPQTATIDPAAKIEVEINQGKTPRVVSQKSGDIPVNVTTGLVGAESM